MVCLCESASFGGICFNALVVYLCKGAENLQGTEQSFGYMCL